MERPLADTKRLVLLVPLLACLQGLSLGQQATTDEAFTKGDPRGVMVEEVRNDTPAFMVRVDVDHADRVYRGGELMRVFVMSEKAGYLYLLYCDADKKMSCLFPNRLGQDNKIPARKTVTIPPAGARFALRIGPPYGKEVLKAIVSLKPLGEQRLRGFLSDKEATRTKLEWVKGAATQFQNQPAQWAEHHAVTTTVAPPPGPDVPPTVPPDGTPPSGRRRVGVFIGISDFRSPDIRDLKVGHKDALALSRIMKQRCGLNEAIVLLDSQATLKNTREAICRRLPAMTKPGDFVIIFWSGHGGRCADDNGDERDGYDEYLVPHDASVANLSAIRRTMLLDDTFGRWMQELDGRRVVVVLDTCHSGGQHNREKSLIKGIDGPEPVGGDVQFDFFDGEFARAKDIGQKETALLASSLAKQVSFERKEGDLGAMTYYLVEQLRGGSSPVTLPAAFNRMKPLVAAYIERTFPGTTQTAVLIDNTTPPLYLRP